jgi:hypothetical protein
MFVLAFGFASFMAGLFGHFQPDVHIPVTPWFHATPAVHIPVIPFTPKKPQVHIPITPWAVHR